MTLEPKKSLPTNTDPHFEVWNRIRQSIAVLPAYFDSETHIEGLRATDIHTLSATLGATIEDQVVNSLNQMRDVWDSAHEYSLYSFIRQTQTFPDVLFARRDPTTSQPTDIIMGIELKGWYVLAKEGEPSFRYQVTPSVCAPKDMVVIVPWHLSNVISGTPKILAPYIESARYAAEYRNYWWEHLRSAKSDSNIITPKNALPYPKKSDQISDHPTSDSGGNFGRYARTHIMDEYIERIDTEEISGIAIQYWRDFFKMFQQDEDRTKIRSALEKLRLKIVNNEQRDESSIQLWTEIGQALGLT